MICELSLRVRAAPRERVYEGVFFEDFAAGVEALRELAQRARARPTSRASPTRQETRMSLALAGAGGVEGPARARCTSARAATATGCLAILGFEGAPSEVARQARARARSWRAAAAG